MIYVTSDLHGFPLAKFKGLLEKATFTDDDHCFILGDVIDRGKESIKLLKWIIQHENIELILGNHESMFLACSFLLNAISDEFLNTLPTKDVAAFQVWVLNGGGETLKELSACDSETVFELVDYLKLAPLYKSVSVNNQDFLLVHSGLGNFNYTKRMSEYTADELLWARPKLTQRYYDTQITIFGHTPTHYYGSEYQGKAVKTTTWIDIDTGAACGGSPMLLRLDDMQEFYVE